MKNIVVILIEPENSGNVGAIARVMKNLGFSRLIIINPKCAIDEILRNRAKHAQDIVDKIIVTDEKILDKIDHLIGTTAIIGTDYNILRTPFTPAEAAERIKKIKKETVGILLGREGSGLSIEEIKKCDFIITIPTDSKYKTMNVSHAATIVLYEISKSREKKNLAGFEMARKQEKDQIEKMINQSLEHIHFTTADKKETQKRVWKRVIGKATLTKREAFAVMGYFKRVNQTIGKKK